MRNWISLVESTQRSYFHGSSKSWPIGSVLRGRGNAYHDDWQSASFYNVLEAHRPESMLSHRDAVFMCGNDDDIDSAGGATDWVVELSPNGPVERHDMNWSSAISAAIDDDESDEYIAELAHRYWHGVASSDPLWEYLTKEATVISCEPF